MKSTDKENSLISSVKNALIILKLFKKDKNEMGVTEIAEQIGMAKSTVHRLVSTLKKEGFLSKNPRTNQYRLGLSLLTLGGVISMHKEIYRDALPRLNTLVNKINETVHICLLEKDEVVYLYRIEGKNKTKLITNIGHKNHLHCTSEGLAIIAFQSQKTIDQFLNRALPAYTPSTVTNPTQLRKLLSQICKDDYVVAKDSYFEGFTGVAAPIRDYTGDVVSSVAVIGPNDRLSEDVYPLMIQEMKAAAEDISELLGYYGEE